MKKVKEVGMSIPAKLRLAGIPVRIEKPVMKEILERKKKWTMKIVQSFAGSVFTDDIGLIKTRPVQLQYEPGFQAVQSHCFGVPYHYQDRLATHLKTLKREGVIEDVAPARQWTSF